MGILLPATITLMSWVVAPPSGEPPQAPAPKVPEVTAKPLAAPAKAGQTVRGKVGVGSGWDLQRPDLSRAVVWLNSTPELDSAKQPTDPAVVIQKDKKFIPGFVVVQRGTSVEFPNWDDFDHNVFSRSKAAPAFDLDRYPKGQSKSRTFDKVGVVQVFCNIHPQMRAIVVVAPTGFFAQANADGEFAITGVPTGTYELVAWHERCGEKKQEIVVVEGKDTQAEFVLEQSRGAILENNPPREHDYGVDRGLGIKREKLNLPVVTDVHEAPAGSDCPACPKTK